MSEDSPIVQNTERKLSLNLTGEILDRQYLRQGMK